MITVESGFTPICLAISGKSLDRMVFARTPLNKIRKRDLAGRCGRIASVVSRVVHISAGEGEQTRTATEQPAIAGVKVLRWGGVSIKTASYCFVCS